MATYCCYSSGNSSDSSSSNSSQLPEQPLLLSWEYLTPPELEPNGCTSRNPQRPSDVVIRSRRSEFTLKKEEKNAKERDRVKRLNNLYLTLRTILGGECKESKLSKVPVLHAAIKYMKDLAKDASSASATNAALLSTVGARHAYARRERNNNDPSASSKNTIGSFLHQHCIYHYNIV